MLSFVLYLYFNAFYEIIVTLIIFLFNSEQHECRQR